MTRKKMATVSLWIPTCWFTPTISQPGKSTPGLNSGRRPLAIGQRLPQRAGIAGVCVTVTQKIRKPLSPDTASRIIEYLSHWRVHTPDAGDVLEVIRIHQRYGYIILGRDDYSQRQGTGLQNNLV